MASVGSIKGLKSLLDKLRDRAAKASKDPKSKVAVGFSTAYALVQHENLTFMHAPGKQAKYLEAPFRVLASSGELNRIVREAVDQGKTLAQALILAGLRVQREAQKVVPIDTGVLRNSAFTVLEPG